MKSFFRVEHPAGYGLWRNADGTYNPVFPKLTVGKCRDVPMPDSPLYGKDGFRWFSTTESLETLLHWFDIKDIEELSKLGYVVSEYQFEDDSVFFKRLNEYESIIVREKASAHNTIPLEKFKE